MPEALDDVTSTEMPAALKAASNAAATAPAEALLACAAVVNVVPSIVTEYVPPVVEPENPVTVITSETPEVTSTYSITRDCCPTGIFPELSLSISSEN